MHRAAFAAAFAFALLTEAGITSAATPACSNDTFAIDGSTVAVQLCVSIPSPVETHRGPVRKAPAALLDETLTVKGQPPLVRSVPLDAAPTDESSRTIDDIPLQKLGLARTLHVTIAVRTAAVRLEHALLVPGAVALK